MKKNIIILGAGFAGWRVALELAKKKNQLPNHEIILVEKRDVHMYTPDLYEIATAYTKEISETCLTELSDSVAAKITTMIGNKPIKFVRDKVVDLIPSKKTIVLGGGQKLKYDKLAIALGSVSNYYDIPGMERFSYPLKTVKHALAIHCDLDHCFQHLWKKGTKKEVHLVVGGGGATGVEFAGELSGCIENLCKKYKYPRSKVKITLVQAIGELIGVSPAFSRKIEGRLRRHGVEVLLNTGIVSAALGSVTIKPAGWRPRKIPSDMLVWAGGVKPHPFMSRHKLKCAKNGAIEVDETLAALAYPDMFAAGDNAAFVDPASGKHAPWLAQVAFAQGAVVAQNILADLSGKPRKKYRLKVKGVIIPVAGRYAVFKSATGKRVYAGFIFWVVRRAIDLLYAMKVMPLGYALKKWWHATGIFIKND